MLRSLSLSHFRCFEGTDRLQFRQLNVLVGPNHAGKSSLLSAIELLVKSRFVGVGRSGPLTFSGQPEFASFSSVLRKHWSRVESRATSFELDAEWTVPPELGVGFWSHFRCEGRSSDDATIVSTARYGLVTDSGRSEILVELKARSAAGVEYRITKPQQLDDPPREVVYFEGLNPVFYPGRIRARASSEIGALRAIFRSRVHRRRTPIVIIRPYRPVPRPLYVLDDPTVSEEDRSFVSFLSEVWGKETKEAQSTKRAILASLRDLRLANHLEVRRPVKNAASVVEIRVSTSSKRNLVTIADVGFGLSQALPLIARDSTLKRGLLISYQPEVHLHPFAQSRLADLFVRSTKRRNVVFVETHSQYLILRLQYLVAQGKILPEDVQIFCVEQTSGRSSVRTMHFDSQGKPTTPWPTGFLDVNLDLARELAAARVRN